MKTKVVGIRLTDNEIAQLNTRAKRLGVSPSKVATQILRDALNLVPPTCHICNGLIHKHHIKLNNIKLCSLGCLQRYAIEHIEAKTNYALSRDLRPPTIYYGGETLVYPPSGRRLDAMLAIPDGSTQRCFLTGLPFRRPEDAIIADRPQTVYGLREGFDKRRVVKLACLLWPQEYLQDGYIPESYEGSTYHTMVMDAQEYYINTVKAEMGIDLPVDWNDYLSLEGMQIV